MKYSFPPEIIRRANTLSVVPLLEFLQEEEQVAAMLRMANMGLPSVRGVSTALKARFGAIVEDKECKKLIGRMIRPIMEAHGYTKDPSKVKAADDPVFGSGARYLPPQGSQETVCREAPVLATKPDDLIHDDLIVRIVKSFTLQELRFVIAVADKELESRMQLES